MNRYLPFYGGLVGGLNQPFLYSLYNSFGGYPFGFGGYGGFGFPYGTGFYGYPFRGYGGFYGY